MLKLPHFLDRRLTRGEVVSHMPVVLSQHITKYSHILTHIHILPQNSRHWPLCKSANGGVAAGNTAERYLPEGPMRLPLWQ
jgi:hypothetical protein